MVTGQYSGPRLRHKHAIFNGQDELISTRLGTREHTLVTQAHMSCGLKLSHTQKSLLWVCDPQDFSAETTDKRYGLIHGRELGYWNVSGLVHTLPVLNLEHKTINAYFSSDSVTH